MLSTLAVACVALASAAADLPSQGHASSPREAREATRIAFGDLVAPGARLAPSSKALALRGKRVRLVGYVAQMEEPPRGAFYLVAHPLRCDESGGGTADLPADAVRVVVRSAAGDEIPFYPGLVDVSGVLAIGNETDDAGHVSFFRLVLDRPEDVGKVAPSPAS